MSAFLLCGLLLQSPLQLVACQTYRDDLIRAQRYYEDNQYAHALALFRALERDTDSLSSLEHARYAYFRGMTDYRLARVEGGNDERFDRYARYWLGLASSIEKENPGGLQEHEKKRLAETLNDLNTKAYGTAATFDEVEPSEAPVAAPPAAPTTGDKCKSSNDCPDDHICQDGACMQL
ncbi:MAG TPA: hypothetical protein VI197_28135 [Polyangiaceae bacterium]